MLKLVADVKEIDVGDKAVDDEMVGDDVVETKPGFGNTVNEILRTDDVLGVVEKSVDDELRSGVKKSVDGELRSGDEPSCLEKSVINNEPTSENETGGEKRVHFFVEGSGFEKSSDDKSDEMACGDEVVGRKRNMRMKNYNKLCGATEKVSEAINSCQFAFYERKGKNRKKKKEGEGEGEGE